MPPPPPQFMPDALREIVIIGITESGSTFRPSDRAERLRGVMSLFGEDQRIRYSPFLRPIISGGVRCALVDARLEPLAPLPFEFLASFARDNELKVRRGREEPHEQRATAASHPVQPADGSVRADPASG